MQNVADIFSAWPTDAEFGRDIGLPYPTVAAWKQRGSIPAAYWRDIVRAARKRGYAEITADLLADLHARPTPADAPPGFAEEAVGLLPPAADAHDGGSPGPRPTDGAGHFTRFKHLRRNRFRTLEEVNDHVAALRDEWDRR